MIEEISKELTMEFQDDDVRTALFQMAHLKFPWLDGFFYKFLLVSMGCCSGRYSGAVLQCLNSGMSLTSVNETYIAPIPKVKSPPQKSTDFNPISLCNVFYKIIAKSPSKLPKKGITSDCFMYTVLLSRVDLL